MKTDSTDSPAFDFIVLGGGSAGYAAARTAASLGMTVAVVDGADELGGLCILRGCMPSKTLIESANRNLILQRAGEFGLSAHPGPPSVRVIRERKRRLISEFASYRQGQLQDGRFTLIRGRAKFRSSHTIEVQPIDGSPSLDITGRTFCIATGSVASIPPVPGLAEAGFWTSDDVLDAGVLPASCIVLGGGAIALEMAHYLDAMGTRVQVIQRSDQFLRGMDKEISDVILQSYTARGIECWCGTHLEHVELADGKKRLCFTHDGQHRYVESEEILVALGRHPATEQLGLHQAHVACAGHKIVVNQWMQTSQAHIFAAGDVCSPLDVVHVAIHQGEIAARNALHVTKGLTPSEAIDYRLLLFGVFSHPQVAAVGAAEADLRSQGTPHLSASYPFNDHGKSMVMGETEGFVKLIAHAETGEILGASCVGPEATELIHEVVVAMYQRLTVGEFSRIPHYHPTLSEIWTYPAEEIADMLGDELKISPMCD